MQSDRTIDASNLTSLGTVLYALRPFQGGEYDRIILNPKILFDAFDQIARLTKAIDRIKDTVDESYEQSL